MFTRCPLTMFMCSVTRTLSNREQFNTRYNQRGFLFKASCQCPYRQYAGTGSMKYWLGLNWYWPAPATLAQHLTYIGSGRLVIAASSKQYQTSCYSLYTCYTNVIIQIDMLLYTCYTNYTNVFTGLSAAQQTRGVEPVLVWCWASVANGGPALDQHWVNLMFAWSVDKCFAPKRNNKFSLKHSLYCPQEPFNNINYKSHWYHIY